MGKSGSGKSDLALRLIDSGARLVSDDYVEIREEENILYASPPLQIEGIIEARGIGLIQLPFQRNIPVKMAVNLIGREEVERLPEPQFFNCLGCHLPLLSLHAYDASTPVKIRFAIAQTIG